ncbi:ribbon-helix-helix domain-containing protein [Laribacter hongkongensis]|uniref:Ribbon-helix-helix domain-containing protein n=1 Tax=Laribacter hongkongensis TaxID=168471 RepID=A0ABD4SXJ5_9NEIS|nr:ribbon-helix-helix domain-containing protein [Laribacter hongkongensis]MCG9027361.1 ribbon-helix-helix domain-containing protein [Laribacter hongkongensis]MCG9057241.1 ribbon-helix-helix domain-containing protein [Laribacter hongkongensis]
MTPNADVFINAAPDGTVSRAPATPARARKRTMKGNKEQISLTISVELVDRLDAMAAKVGQTRAALINMAIYQLLDRGMTIEP